MNTHRSRVVITGGPCSGKTTLVQALRERGFHTLPEAALTVIERLNREYGVVQQKTWRRSHPVEFQRLVTQQQAEQETRIPADAGVIFCDRGRYDALAYFQLFEIVMPEDLLRLIEETAYAQVFLLDTLSDFSQRADTGRTSDRQASIRLCALLEQVYQHYGYTPIHVPECPLQQRIDRVLRYLGIS
ncbi:MAG: ATP-binding protein [bacterium]|nr:ATP-binding protein [bacterium]